jgi:myo-inositol-1(or 4)-monophosphatase
MSGTRVELLKTVSRAAGRCLQNHFGGELNIRKKGELDLVTAADEAAEKLIVAQIASQFPADAVIAEEGSSRDGNSGYAWIVDPLDGTTNFAHQFPHFSVSIALSRDERVVAGVVYDPMKDEFFFAQAGGGAFLNGQPMRVADRQHLSEAMAVTGFSYDRRQRMPELLGRVERILQHCQGFRRLGSAALDLAYVACGRFDLFLEDGLHAWDMAAGLLLVTEAGGLCTNLDGSQHRLFGDQVLATNPRLHGQALTQLI